MVDSRLPGVLRYGWLAGEGSRKGSVLRVQVSRDWLSALQAFV